jgi:hypothetical protein
MEEVRAELDRYGITQLAGPDAYHATADDVAEA